MSSSTTSRVSAFMAAFIASAMVLAGCAGGDEETTTQEASEGFPVTVEGSYGPVTIDTKPERILAIGVETVDMLNALDEQPVAFAGAGFEEDEAMLNESYPWVEDLYTDEFDPSIISVDTLEREVVASHNPDLIIGSSYFIDESAAEELSKIAPTFVKVASGDRDWTDDFEDIAALVGKSDRVDGILADVDAEFAEARETLGGLQGKTFNMAWVTPDGLRLPPAYGWAEDLGFVPADNQPQLGAAAVNLSKENLPEFAGDIAFVSAREEQVAELEADPRFDSLPSVANGTMIFTQRPVIDAGLSVGPSSLTWLLTQILPELQESPLNNS